jgi:hypothetical protein
MIAVLQAWSKSTFPGRSISVAFMVAMGLAAHWGARVLGWIR